MNPPEIRRLVDRGVKLVRIIAKFETELKAVETALKAAGHDGEHQELKDADREGRRFIAHGSRLAVPVIFTADKIVASFKQDSELHKRLTTLLTPEQMAHFYRPTTTYEHPYKSGKSFRAAADQFLPKELAPKFITACLSRDKNGIPKSDVKIDWDKAEPITKEAK